MSAWAKVKARVDDERAIDKPVAVDVAPSAAAPKDLGPQVKKSRAQRLRGVHVLARVGAFSLPRCKRMVTRTLIF